MFVWENIATEPVCHIFRNVCPSVNVKILPFTSSLTLSPAFRCSLYLNSYIALTFAFVRSIDNSKTVTMVSLGTKLWCQIEMFCKYMPIVLNTVLVFSITAEVSYLVIVEAPLEPDQKKTEWSTIWKSIHLFSQYFMLVNITWNAWLFVKTTPSIRGVFLGGEAMGQGWR